MSNQAMQVAGTTVAFSPTLPATYDQAGYEAVAGWTEGDCHITSVGDLGREWSEINFKTVCDRMETSRKGSYKWSQFTLEMNRVFSDAAQTVLEDAEKSDDPIAIRVSLPDGTKIYFTALNMGMPLSMGGVDDMMKSTVKLQPVSKDFVQVDP